jgi:hypothetical protein
LLTPIILLKNLVVFSLVNDGFRLIPMSNNQTKTIAHENLLLAPKGIYVPVVRCNMESITIPECIVY